jgi:AraC-like DNA-binding protein
MLNGMTQLARTPLLLLDYAAKLGMDRNALLDVAGLSKKDLADPDSRIRSASMLKLWRAVIDRQDDKALGVHIGSTIRASELGLVGYAMYHARDLHNAFRSLVRYGRIISEAVQFKLEEHDEHAVLIWQSHPSLTVLRHPAECGIAIVVSVAREISGSDLQPLQVELPSPRPELLADYRAVFRCPVLFDRPAGSVTFSRQQIELPTIASDETLAGYLGELAAITVKPLAERDASTTSAVRHVLWSLLPAGRADLWRTAAEMDISARTLQRRLGEEGSSFSRVLDELRRDLANELLSDSKLAVSEVAFLLGYSEPSAFQRAFRRWYDDSPRRFRIA